MLKELRLQTSKVSLNTEKMFSQKKGLILLHGSSPLKTLLEECKVWARDKAR